MNRSIEKRQRFVSDRTYYCASKIWEASWICTTLITTYQLFTSVSFRFVCITASVLFNFVSECDDFNQRDCLKDGITICYVLSTSIISQLLMFSKVHSEVYGIIVIIIKYKHPQDHNWSMRVSVKSQPIKLHMNHYRTVSSETTVNFLQVRCKAPTKFRDTLWRFLLANTDAPKLDLIKNLCASLVVCVAESQKVADALNVEWYYHREHFDSAKSGEKFWILPKVRL